MATPLDGDTAESRASDRPPGLPSGTKASAVGQREHLVLLAGVGQILELDAAQLGELLAEPAVAGIEQAELLAVGHDLGEEHGLEGGAVGRLQNELDGVFDRHAHPVEDLLLEEAVPHPYRRLEGEFLA